MSSSTASPTVSRRWLALEMRRLRKERRLSQAAVAGALGCQVPKVSHIETGQRPLQDHDLKKLLELFKVTEDDRQQYFDELENAQEKGWWEHHDETTVPPWFKDFVGLEQGAERIRAYQPAVVHGLLQTSEYATGIYHGLAGRWSTERIRRNVDVRGRRQEVVLRQPGGAELWVIMDEAALRRVVGSRAIMQAQLEHVAELARSRANITVQIVPFDRGGSYEAIYGSFTVLDFPLASDPGVVYMEQHMGGAVYESLEQIDKYSGLFEQLSAQAASLSESLEMLHVTAEHYGTV
jgi:transcriptional regulator with XRE-family HTH domain